MKRPLNLSSLFHPSRRVRRNDADVPWLPSRKVRGPIEEVDPWTTEAWRMWHQKEPREVLKTEFDFPETMIPVGKAKKIYYKSDKWERDNDFYTYYHNFDSQPTVYAARRSSLAQGVRARRNEEEDVAEFLNVEHVNASFSLPILATTLQLDIVGFDGKKKSKKFRPAPLLCCTEDLKTLVILAEGEPIIIRGGQMVVTERGIVR